MSLLLELIRQLLEYLGVPVDQLEEIIQHYANRQRILHAIETHLSPVLFTGINLQLVNGWERKEYGWTRSIVRVIATLLPFDPSPRPHFQVILDLSFLGYREVCRPGVPSLADIPWVSDDDNLSYTKFRHNLLVNQPREAISLVRPSDRTRDWEAEISPSSSKSGDISLAPSGNTIQKIAALEEELIQLRAQIATIVSMQDSRNVQSCSETLCLFGSPDNALPPPTMASTPTSVPIPPPPPPPAPPLPSVKLSPGKSAIDLIKQRRQVQKHRAQEEEMREKDGLNKVPSMMDILKGINTIRLRSVERSPGGTPLTRKDKKRRSLNDPAAIIAQALKQKFAHRRCDDSFDKENRSHEESAFSSPETPQFGRHLLKPVGSRNQRKQVLMTTEPNV
ncbi:mitochondrial fission regulator 2 [Pelodytes ibericus]